MYDLQRKLQYLVQHKEQRFSTWKLKFNIIPGNNDPILSHSAERRCPLAGGQLTVLPLVRVEGQRCELDKRDIQKAQTVIYGEAQSSR